MVWLNKVVWFCLMPLTIGWLLLLAGLVLLWVKRRRTGVTLQVFALLWIWVWSSQVFYRFLGGCEESPYPPVKAEKMPKADAIVVLGGGVGSSPKMPYPEMFQAADRVWHAARLYKAGRASVVIPTGSGDELAVVPLLLDFGVPQRAIKVEKKARNTEEHVKYVEELIRSLPQFKDKDKPSILLVTSAWHMKRSMLNFSRCGLEVIPAATDHEATLARSQPYKWEHFLPRYEYLTQNSVLFKEWVGYWLYRVKHLFVK